MNQLQLFEGRSVPKRKVKRNRIRSKMRRQAAWLRLHAAEIAANRDRASIRQTMRCPKLLSGAMPRVVLKEKYLQRPRSPESEFGLTFKPPSQRKELAEFIGCSAAAGIVADVAEAEFFRTKRRDSLGGFGKKNAIKRY
jgi:hypothetical protein